MRQSPKGSHTAFFAAAARGADLTQRFPAGGVLTIAFPNATSRMRLGGHLTRVRPGNNTLHRGFPKHRLSLALALIVIHGILVFPQAFHAYATDSALVCGQHGEAGSTGLQTLTLARHVPKTGKQ